jgi:hypothetical protein
VAGLAAAIDRVEVQIRAAVPTVDLIYIEPDLYRTEVTEAAAEPDPG